MIDGAITVRAMDVSAVKDGEAARWARLTATTLEPNPYLHPAVVLGAHRWMGSTEGLWLVVAEEGDRWVGVLGLRVLGRFPGTPLHYASTTGRVLEEVAAVRTPLIDRRAATDVLEAMLRFLGSPESPVPGLVELTWQLGDGPFVEILRHVCRRLRMPCQVRARFERAYAYADPGRSPREHLSSRRRKQLGRHTRGLERELGATLELVDHGGSPGAVDAFRRLRDAGWKGRPHDDDVPQEHRGGWFVEAMSAFADSGMLHVFELRGGGVALYMSVVVRAGGTCLGIADTYNEDYARYSPGALGRLLELEHLMTVDGVTEVDPCLHPRYVEATGLYPDLRPTLTLLIATRGAARLLLPARPAVAAAGRTAATAVAGARRLLRSGR